MKTKKTERLTQKKNEKRGVLSIPKENIEAAPKIDTATVAIVTVETEGDRVREAVTTIDPATAEDARGLLMTEEKDTEGTTTETIEDTTEIRTEDRVGTGHDHEEDLGTGHGKERQTGMR